jgi:hypothetical protein
MHPVRRSCTRRNLGTSSALINGGVAVVASRWLRPTGSEETLRARDKAQIIISLLALLVSGVALYMSFIAMQTYSSGQICLQWRDQVVALYDRGLTKNQILTLYQDEGSLNNYLTGCSKIEHILDPLTTASPRPNSK